MYIQGLVDLLWSDFSIPLCIFIIICCRMCSLWLSLVLFYIVWRILPRYFWYRFLVLVSTSLTWSCLVDGEIEIHCASLKQLDWLWQSPTVGKLSYVRPRLFQLFKKFRSMLKTRYLAGMKSLNLYPSELMPFLLLSSTGLDDRRAHASKCCFVCSVAWWR